MILVWIALVLSLAAVAATTIDTTMKGVRVFRDSRRLGRLTGAELERIEAATGHIERHLLAAERSSEALQASIARLSRSRAQLNVLLEAIAEVRASIERVTVFIPSK